MKLNYTTRSNRKNARVPSQEPSVDGGHDWSGSGKSRGIHHLNPADAISRVRSGIPIVKLGHSVCAHHELLEGPPS